MAVTLSVHDDPAGACAALLLEATADGGNVVLTGGSTPKPAYQEFVRRVDADGLDVAGTTVWFTDERAVPPEDERSNYGLIKETVIDPLGSGRAPQVRRIKGELGPVAAADDYESQLRQAGPPEFDLMLIGMGPDGHICSMFPDQDSLSERERLVVGVEQSGLDPLVPRITLTLPAIALARHVVFLITGAGKAAMVLTAFGPDARPNPHVPATEVPPVAANVTVLLDPASASEL